MSGFGGVKIYRPDSNGVLVLAETVPRETVSKRFFEQMKQRGKDYSEKNKFQAAKRNRESYRRKLKRKEVGHDLD
jgi:hypothetical protein